MFKGEFFQGIMKAMAGLVSYSTVGASLMVTGISIDANAPAFKNKEEVLQAALQRQQELNQELKDENQGLKLKVEILEKDKKPARLIASEKVKLTKPQAPPLEPGLFFRDDSEIRNKTFGMGAQAQFISSLGNENSKSSRNIASTSAPTNNSPQNSSSGSPRGGSNNLPQKPLASSSGVLSTSVLGGLPSGGVSSSESLSSGGGSEGSGGGSSGGSSSGGGSSGGSSSAPTAVPTSFAITGATGGTDVTLDNQLTNGTTVTVNWADSSGESSYDVTLYESNGTTVKCATQNVTADSTSHTFTGCTLSIDSTYKIKVLAKNSLGNTISNNDMYSFLVAQAPTAFTITGATGGSDVTSDNQLTSGTTVTANWNDSVGETSYDVTIYENDGTTVKCATQNLSANTQSYTFIGCSLVIAASYKIKVVANNSTASPAASNDLFSFTLAQSPAAFSITGATGGTDVTANNQLTNGSNVTSNWADTNGEASYDVTVYENDGTTVKCATQNVAANTTSYNFGACSLSIAASYKIKVVANNAFGNTAASNDMYAFVVAQAPAAFSITGATGGTDVTANNQLTNGVNVTANWGDTTGEASYDVTIYESDGTTVKCATQNVVSNTVANAFGACTLTIAASYKIKVVANNAYGTTAATNDLFDFAVAQAPAAFNITGATGGTDVTADNQLTNGVNATANWNDALGEASFDVTIYENDGTTVKCATQNVTANTVLYAFSSCTLYPSFTYKIKVIANNAYGNTTATNSLYAFNLPQLAPVLNTIADKTFPSNQIDQKVNVALDYNDTANGPASDNGMSYACVYDRVIDGAVAAGTSCTDATNPLPGLPLSFSSSTGILSWTPNAGAWGAYEIKVTGTNGTGNQSKVIVLDVRQLYGTANLRANYDALFADLVKPVSGACSQWRDLTTNAFDINSCTNGTWAGNGAYSNPYALGFVSTGKADLGSSVMSGQSQVMFNTWLAPTSAASPATVILGDGGGSGNGFVLRQSQTQAGKLEIFVGKSYYKDVVLADSPAGYWRLGENGVTTTAIDISGFGRNGTYVSTASPLPTIAGALSSDSDSAITFNGANSYINVGNVINPTAALTLSAWVKTTSIAGRGFVGKWSNTVDADSAQSYGFYVYTDGKAVFSINGYDQTDYNLFGNAVVNDGNWHFLVATIHNSSSTNNMKIYVDGALDVQTSIPAGNIIQTTTDPLYIGTSAKGYWDGNGGNPSFNGSVDEVAIYEYALTPTQILNQYNAGLANFYKDRVLALNPVSYWRLGELSGTVAVDLKAANTGTYTGGVKQGQSGALTSRDGDPDPASSFDGVDDYVLLKNGSIIGSQSQGSISFWVSSAAAPPGSQHALYSEDTTGTVFQIYRDSSNQVYFGRLRSAAWAYVGTGVLTWGAGNWHHITLTWTSSSIKMYANGAITGTTADNGATDEVISNSWVGRFGQGAPYYFNGLLDEVAIFNYTLTDGQIAALYNGSRYFCRTQTILADNAWNFISGIWDSGTGTAKLFVNGRQECAAIPGTTFTTPATNLTMAATAGNTNNWSGSVASTRVYASGTASNVKTDFDATADTFRENPVGDIVTSGLILNLDAANAKEGMRPQANGCAALNWYDLSSYNHTGELSSFAGCGATSGWNGNGTSADPYRLSVDGTDDRVRVAHSTAFDITGGITVEAWIKPTALMGNKDIVQNGIGTGKMQFYLRHLSGTDLDFGIDNGSRSYILSTSYASAGVANGTWSQVTAVVDDTAQIIKFYSNGAQIKSAGLMASGANTPNSDYLDIGGDDWDGYFNGNIADVKVYNRALSTAEVQQNCRALKSRFSGLTCSTADEVSCTGLEGGSCTATCPAGKTVSAVKYVRYGDTACGNMPNIHGAGGVCSGTPSCIGSASCLYNINNAFCGDTCFGWGKTGILVVTCQ